AATAIASPRPRPRERPGACGEAVPKDRIRRRRTAEISSASRDRYRRPRAAVISPASRDRFLGAQDVARDLAPAARPASGPAISRSRAVSVPRDRSPRPRGPPAGGAARLGPCGPRGGRRSVIELELVLVAELVVG